MGNKQNIKTKRPRRWKPGKIDTPLNKKLKNVEWGEYRLGDLFDIVGTKSLDSNAIEFVSEGINFVGRTFDNNGIQGKIEKRNFEPNAPFTITATIIGNYKYVKYQKEPYYCSQNINKLMPKPLIKKVWNEKVAYFIIANIQKYTSTYNGQQAGYKLDDINKHIIKLPTKNNAPDFEFMEIFIAELEAKRIAELEAYLSATGLKGYELTKEEEDIIVDLENLQWRNVGVTEIFNIKNTKNHYCSAKHI